MFFYGEFGNGGFKSTSHEIHVFDHLDMSVWCIYRQQQTPPSRPANLFLAQTCTAELLQCYNTVQCIVDYFKKCQEGPAPTRWLELK